MPSDLKERIQAATLKSLKSRNRYNDSITAQLTQSLNKAEQEVAQAICGKNFLLRDHAPSGGAPSAGGGLGVRRRRSRSASACFRRPSGSARRSRCRFVACQQRTARRQLGA